MIELKGIAWDHPRGYEPLVAASNEFSRINPNASIVWDVRSLKKFGDMPIEDLIGRYDLITIDHPYLGQANKNGLLLELEKYVAGNVLTTLRTQSVGPSFESYNYKSHVYALPIDAAALVAAYRKDYFTEFELDLPTTHTELKSFYLKMPKGFSLAWALCSTDFWCTFLMLYAQTTGLPVSFSNTPQKIEKPAPLLNEYASEILKEFCNYSDEEIDYLALINANKNKAFIALLAEGKYVKDSLKINEKFISSLNIFNGKIKLISSHNNKEIGTYSQQQLVNGINIEFEGSIFLEIIPIVT